VKLTSLLLPRSRSSRTIHSSPCLPSWHAQDNISFRYKNCACIGYKILEITIWLWVTRIEIPFVVGLRKDELLEDEMQLTDSAVYDVSLTLILLTWRKW
jgi:hypothetical protein